jgi:hypothetical protein
MHLALLPNNYFGNKLELIYHSNVIDMRLQYSKKTKARNIYMRKQFEV